MQMRHASRRTTCNLVVFLIIANTLVLVVSFGWTKFPHSKRQTRIRDLPLRAKAEEEDTENWREFRAKLVQQNKATTPSANADEESSSSSWAYEAGTLIEQGSIVLSRVESTLGCHDLRQPYFHKCAVLVLEHDEDSTRGIILNRPSNLVCTDGDILLLEEDVEDQFSIDPDLPTASSSSNSTWPMNFGGDISGLFSEEPMLVALHSLAKSSLARECSEEVLPNLWVTSHSGARSLIALGEAVCEDFYSFYGFALWEHGMLQREVDRGSWYIVSMDSQSVLDSLQHLRQEKHSPQEGGIKCWEDWTQRIQKEKQERVEESRDSFTDLMLKEWCQEMLCTEDDDDDEDYTFNMFEAMETADDTVGPGSIVQASSDPSTYMLFDQLFRKSTILVLKEADDFSLGLILNLPTIDAYGHEKPDGTKVRIPIRYGGPLGYYEDDGDDTDKGTGGAEIGASRIIWLHNNKQLREMMVGQSISAKSSSWTCSQLQALNAIDMGLAKASDFLAIQGHVLWEKEMGVGGVAGQIVSGALQELSTDRVDEVWAILGNQSMLASADDVKLTFAKTNEAWELGQVATDDEDETKSPDPSRCVYGTAVTLPELADEALCKWIEIFLWENRKYIPF
jgi:putative AlgH/UPF0301 family transcriptional regulator